MLKVISPERNKELLEQEEEWKREQSRKKRFKVIAAVRRSEYKEQSARFNQRAANRE